MADISGRLAIQNLMCNTLRAIYASHSADLLPTMYLCTSCVAAAHAGIELGVGDAILIKVPSPWPSRQFHPSVAHAPPLLKRICLRCPTPRRRTPCLVSALACVKGG